jgi:hypothetical protein
MRELNARVGNNGILRVGSNGYSVPSGLDPAALAGLLAAVSRNRAGV